MQTWRQYITLFTDKLYISEDQILAQNFGSLPAEESAKTHITQEYQWKYSDAIGAFIDRQMAENRWKRTTLPDHTHRLNIFLSIIGDKPLGAISRDDMLALRATLCKLPPRWNRDAKFQGKTPQEIIAASPKTVLNVRTVNEIMRAIGSFLAWCEAEGKLGRNPAERLQIKDDRSEVDLKEPFSGEDLLKIFGSSLF